MGNIHINSFKSVQIEALSKETKASLGYATGFICNYKDKYFLLTNWHVVSGRNFESKEIIHASGAVPGYFNLTFQVGKNKTETSLQPMTCNIPNLVLYDYKIEEQKLIMGDTPLWIEHPEKGSDMDIAAIEITSDIPHHEEIATIAYEIEKESEKNFPLNVMDNVFIVGYPLKSTTTPNAYPIYKGATIASEPNVFKDLPMFYIDGKTKKGMSGSPVIKRENLKVTQDEAKISFTEGNVNLIGIYSGRERQSKDEHEAELGIVWRMIECIIPTIEQALIADTVNKSFKGVFSKIVTQAKKPK